MEPLIVDALEPLPEPLPQLALFPAAKAVVDGVPVAELIGQVPPRNPGACLVQDGFDEHPVAELRRAAGGVLELPQHRFDCRPQRITDQQASSCALAEAGSVAPGEFLLPQTCYQQREFTRILPNSPTRH